MFYYLDIIGTAAFAASGALAAMRKRLDFFGIFIIACVTAVGGGTLRDILLKVDIAWMRDMNYMYASIVATIFTMMFYRTVKTNSRTLAILDSIGLGVFTIAGIEKGIAGDFVPAICIALGTMSACFGGVIRDMLSNEIPIIFHKEIYATACIIGGVVYFVLWHFDFTHQVYTFAAAMTVVSVRLLSLHFDWQLPNIYGNK
ncbi:MAG: trimeric intracellular cation channel family protein [Saprospiraceae bacterium]|nr:MAG: membrane protein [Bacteroidetes bacterium OLB9]MCO6464260.1 trimeric intracellular cation channel family protein [Saprospiraceae bacterium]